jgi:hypothetical protein
MVAKAFHSASVRNSQVESAHLEVRIHHVARCKGYHPCEVPPASQQFDLTCWVWVSAGMAQRLSHQMYKPVGPIAIESMMADCPAPTQPPMQRLAPGAGVSTHAFNSPRTA